MNHGARVGSVYKFNDWNYLTERKETQTVFHNVKTIEECLYLII